MEKFKKLKKAVTAIIPKKRPLPERALLMEEKKAQYRIAKHLLFSWFKKVPIPLSSETCREMRELRAEVYPLISSPAVKRALDDLARLAEEENLEALGEIVVNLLKAIKRGEKEAYDDAISLRDVFFS